MKVSLTPKQIELLKIYCRKAKLPIELVIEWIMKDKTTISEISRWILGERCG